MNTIEVAAAQRVGGRTTMQDEYFVTNGAIGVFDGHGLEGGAAATFAAHVFENTLKQHQVVDSTTFLDCDEALASVHGGTTATVVTYTEGAPGGYREIRSRWVGDSAALLIRPEDMRGLGGILNITRGHNVYNPNEVDRMKSLGTYAVNGHFYEDLNGHGIALSRALGNHDMPSVIADPEEIAYRSRAHRLLLVTTDGVITHRNKEDVAFDVVSRYLAGEHIGDIAEEIAALYSARTHDNSTIVIADLPELPMLSR